MAERSHASVVTRVDEIATPAIHRQPQRVVVECVLARNMDVFWVTTGVAYAAVRATEAFASRRDRGRLQPPEAGPGLPNLLCGHGSMV